MYRIDSDPDEFGLAVMETQGGVTKQTHVRSDVVRELVRSNTNAAECVITKEQNVGILGQRIEVS